MAIEGAPGGGKTTICEEVANELKVGFIEKHMPTMLVEDFGIMYPNGDDMLHYKLPDWYPSQDRKSWLTSVKLGIYMVYHSKKVGWLSRQVTDSLTEQVLIVYCLTCVIVRLCMNLKHTLMTGVHGLLTTE